MVASFCVTIYPILIVLPAPCTIYPATPSHHIATTAWIEITRGSLPHITRTACPLDPTPMGMNLHMRWSSMYGDTEPLALSNHTLPLQIADTVFSRSLALGSAILVVNSSALLFQPSNSSKKPVRSMTDKALLGVRKPTVPLRNKFGTGP